jgi:hypothetical protein
MIWILGVRGAATKLRNSPFTEVDIEGVHSVVYRPGVVPVPFTGADAGEGLLGTFGRGLHRASGLVFSYDGSAAESLLSLEEPIDLIVRYRGGRQVRKRTFLDVVFVGDSSVTFPAVNIGEPLLVAVPFRVQIPEGETLAEHIVDAADS